jgi:hypothetical protein
MGWASRGCDVAERHQAAEEIPGGELCYVDPEDGKLRRIVDGARWYPDILSATATIRAGEWGEVHRPAAYVHPAPTRSRGEAFTP